MKYQSHISGILKSLTCESTEKSELMWCTSRETNFAPFCPSVWGQWKLTFDQLPAFQLAGQGICVLQADVDSGLGMCLQSLGSRASCSSAPTARTQRTVLLAWPRLPQLAEHLCQSPTHHLHRRHKESNDFQIICMAGMKMTVPHHGPNANPPIRQCSERFCESLSFFPPQNVHNVSGIG